MAEKKQMPAIRFKGFREGWEETDLSKTVDLRSGRDYKHLEDGDVPVYGTGGYMLSVNEALSYDEDAIGIGRKGTIDKPFILKSPFWTVDTLFYAVPKDENDLQFIYDLFQKINWKQKDESTGVPSLSKVAINSISIFSTSPKEQTQIGSYFQNLDKLINLHQAKLNKLVNLKKAMLEKMFPKVDTDVPEIRFKGFEGAWEQRPLLGNIEKLIDFRGRTPKKLGMDWSESGHLALSALNVKIGYIDKDIDAHYGDQDLYDKWMCGNELHKHQVLMTTEAPMGNVAQIPDNNRYILSQRTIAFEVIQELITEDFLAVSLRTDLNFRKLTQLSSGGTAKGVSQKSLSSMVIFVPTDIDEQTQIGSYFKNFDELLKLHQTELDKLNNLKKACLEKMFV